MNKILVTGGSGFIGSNFVHYYIENHPEWSVVNLDKLSYSGNPANHKELEGHERYQFIQGDIADANVVDQALEGVTTIVNFAAETHVDRSIDSAQEFFTSNVMGTLNLLEMARKKGIKKFLHMSTDEVYGSIETGTTDENAPLLPNSPYSASKASVDLLIRSFWKTYDYSVTILRCSNNYGPYQFPEKIVPLFVTNLMKGETVPLYGKGEHRREWIHVEDTCRAIDLILEKGGAGEIYNIGTAHEITNVELTHAILKEMGCDESNIRWVKDRAGHDLRYALNLEKIKKLGFKPKWTFGEGLRATIKWYQENQDWWMPLKKDKFTVK